METERFGIGLQRKQKIKKIVLFVIIKLLRLIIITNLFYSFINYQLAKSVPPNLSLEWVKEIVIINVAMAFFSLLDFLVCIKQKFRGGFFTICSEMCIILLWVVSGNYGYNKDLVGFINIMLCITHILLQLITILKGTIWKRTFFGNLFN